MDRSAKPAIVDEGATGVVQTSRRRFLRGGAGLVVGLTTFSGVVAACTPPPAPAAPTAEPSKPAESKPGASTQGTAAPAAKAPAAASGTQLVPFFSTETDPPAQQAIVKATTDFKKENPNVEVDMVVGATSSSRGERLVRSFTVGQELGIFELEDYFREDWVKAGYLTPLDDVVQEIGENEFVKGSLFRAADGHYYGLPTQINPMLFWIRTDLFQQAGLKEPTNALELVEAAKALTSGNQYGTSLALGPNRATTTVFFPVVNQHGGDFFDRQGNLTFDQPQVLEAVKRHTELLSYSPPGVANWGYTEMQNAFLTGNIAIGRASGQYVLNLVQKAPQLVSVTKMLPADPLGGPLSGQVSWGRWTQLAISSNTKSIDAAKKFLKFFVTGERAENWISVLPGKVSAISSVSEKVLNGNNEFIKQHKALIAPYFETAKTAVTPDSNMGSVTGGKFEKTSLIMPWAAGIWGGTPVDAAMLQKIVVGKEPVEQAWQWAVGEMKRISDEWKAANPGWKPSA